MSTTFTLETANRIANLTCDRIESVYISIYQMPELFEDFCDWLTSFAQTQCIGTRAAKRDDMLAIRDELQKLGYHTPFFGDNSLTDISEAAAHREKALQILIKLAQLLEAYPVKSLLLPRFCRDDVEGISDDFMLDPSTVARLQSEDPDNTCLILQATQLSHPDRVTVFDIFPHFEVALRQIDLWPAVLFWNHTTGAFAFIPVADIDDLRHIYSLAREPEPYAALNRLADARIPASHYFMQLSDFHLEEKTARLHTRELETLIVSQMESFDPKDTVEFLVTGDIVNSPTSADIKDSEEIIGFLERLKQEQMIFVLGNHDIEMYGLAFGDKHQKWQYLSGDYPKTKVYDDINVILMLFDSNVDGLLAEGKIGQKQMDAMKKQLDGIKDLDKYTLVAVLHHHVASTATYKFIMGNDRWRQEVGSAGFTDKGKQWFKRLLDADQFLAFLDSYGCTFVVHGHKHIPLVIKRDDMYIISCGSTTGYAKDFISYNSLKFNGKTLACTQFVEQKPESGIDRTDVMAFAVECKQVDGHTETIEGRHT